MGLTDTSILGGQETGLETHVHACILTHTKRGKGQANIDTDRGREKYREGKNGSEGEEISSKTDI